MFSRVCGLEFALRIFGFDPVLRNQGLTRSLLLLAAVCGVCEWAPGRARGYGVGALYMYQCHPGLDPGSGCEVFPWGGRVGDCVLLPKGLTSKKPRDVLCLKLDPNAVSPGLTRSLLLLAAVCGVCEWAPGQARGYGVRALYMHQCHPGFDPGLGVCGVTVWRSWSRGGDGRWFAGSAEHLAGVHDAGGVDGFFDGA